LEISWSTDQCESFGVNTTVTGLECGSLDVPMDYHDSSAGNARLAVIKLAATANKLGTIFFNPGNSLRVRFVVVLRRSNFYRWTRRLRTLSPS